MANSTLDTAGIWSRLSADLRRFIRRRVPDDATADDLLQEVFVRIHRGLPTLTSDDRLTSWVYRIARNTLIDYYRQRSSAPVPSDFIDELPETYSGHDHRTRILEHAGEWLTEIIDTLPPTYRQAVRLAEVEGLAQQEIAQRLGLSLSATKSRIQRSRLAFKEALLKCCQFGFDRRGNLTSCDPLPNRTVCRNCDDLPMDCP